MARARWGKSQIERPERAFGDDRSAILAELLRAGKREIVTVNSGFKALALLDFRKPALIILTFNLPVLDGLTLLKVIRQMPGRQDVPVAMRWRRASRA